MNQKYKNPVKKISLKEKLILYFLLLGIGAIALLSLFSFYSAREALLNRTFKQLTSLRTVKKNQIEQFFHDRTRDILFLARSPELQELLLEGGYYRALYVLDAQGQIIDSLIIKPKQGELPSKSLLPMVGQRMTGCGKGEVRIFDEMKDPATGRPVMFMGCCIDGNWGAALNNKILLLELSIDAINTIMLNNDPESGLGLSGETYLVGPDYKMRSASRFIPNSILKTTVRTKPAIEALEGREGCIITEDYRGIPVLSSFKKVNIDGLNWVLLAEIDLQEAMVPVFEIRTKILFLSVLIISVFFIFVFMIARRITKPIIRLKNAALHVGSGRYDVTLPIETSDEIGSLTEAFNQMALQIKENTLELQNERFGRMRSVIDGEEMERQRLSRELHDGIGQLLIAIKLRLEGLLYTDGKDMEPSIQELKRYFDTIIDEVRRISNNLMPSVLEAFGITIAFRNLFADTEELSGVRIQFTSKGNFDDLDKKTKTYIYRLTQEALSNIVKHSEAKEVQITLLREKETLTLVIKDNGKGFSTENAGKEGGNGIHNMRERVTLLQGNIDLRSSPTKGTTITIHIPIIIPYANNQDFPRG